MKGNNTLNNIIVGNKQAYEQKRIYQIIILARAFRRKLKMISNIETGDKPSLKTFKADKLEDILDKYRSTYTSEEHWLEVCIKVFKDLLGDPETMIKEQFIRLQALPYWNPTTYRVNIHALGVVKTLKSVDTGRTDWTGNTIIQTTPIEFETFVEPGHTVGIPYTHTIGGKHSAINGVAPQLKPLPTQHLEWFGEDLTPTTYAEWCTYIKPDLITKCCARPLGWNVKSHQLVCSKCGAACSA